MIALDRMHKDFFKEFGAPQKSKVTPNLNFARKSVGGTTPESSPGTSGTSNLQNSPTDGWELPKKTSKAATTQLNIQPSECETNRFLPLSEENDIDIDGEEKDTFSSNTFQKRKNLDTPPINIQKSTVNKIIEIITSLNIPKSAFLIKETDIGAHTAYINSLEHYASVCTRLTELNIHYYTYTPKHLKLKSILIKGIRGSFDADEVKQEILELNIPGVDIINLTKFIFDKAQPNKYHFLLQLSNESKTTELFKIKAIPKS